MDLLSLLKRKKENKEFFLAVIIKHFSVGCILFQEDNGKLSILRTAREEIQNIEKLNEEDLLEALDRVISQAEEEEEKKGLNIEKTIFCVPYDWVTDGKLKQQELVKLSKFSKELGLKPLGFIVPIEALANSLKEKTGAPISGVFVEKEPEDKVIIYIVRNNNVIERREGNLENPLSASVETLLKKVESLDVLPAKIIILPFENNSHYQQEFLSFSWTRSLPFLHLPKIEIIDQDFENEAVVNGVAQQMGFEIPKEQIKEKIEETKEEEKNKEAEIMANLETEDFGFKENVDMFLEKEKAPASQEKQIENDYEYQEEITEKEKIKSFTFLTIFLTTLQKIFKKIFLATKKIFKVFKKIDFPHFKFSLKNKLLVFLALLIIFLIAGGFIYYYFILRVNVVLFLDKKILNKDLVIAFSQEANTDFSQNVVHVEKVEKVLEAEKTKNATGNKETGDPASGMVTIYNKTDQDKIFSQGAIIVSQNGLNFALKNDVKVASTGAYTNTLSSADAGVVATKFGPEGNLTSNNNFNFKDYPVSSYYAKNNDSFSGGTKRDIQVVSADDLASLSKSLTDSLTNQAKTELSQGTSPENIFLDQLSNNSLVEKDFDKKEGDEASQVKMHAKIKFDAFYYNKKDLIIFLKNVKEDVPDYFILDQNGSREEIKNIVKNKKGDLTATLSLTALYLPKLDSGKISQTFKSKKIKDAENKINSIQGVSSFQFLFKNKIDFLPDIFPINPARITITERIND